MSTDENIEHVVIIIEENDIVIARRRVREASNAIGFGLTDTTKIVTAASELARNIFKYAGNGIMYIHELEDKGIKGIELSFIDNGPGISDIKKVMEEGYSTSGGFGMGLPGAKRLMDEMDIQSKVGHGAKVVIRKWQKSKL
jgi:serine/threonine-protein kinase RsbT